MKGLQSRQILNASKKEGNSIEFIGDDQEVKLDGTFTAEEIEAILHRMEYYD